MNTSPCASGTSSHQVLVDFRTTRRNPGGLPNNSVPMRTPPQSAILRDLEQAHRALAALAEHHVFQVLRLELRVLMVRKRETTSDRIEHSQVVSSFDQQQKADSRDGRVPGETVQSSRPKQTLNEQFDRVDAFEFRQRNGPDVRSLRLYTLCVRLGVLAQSSFRPDPAASVRAALRRTETDQIERLLIEPHEHHAAARFCSEKHVHVDLVDRRAPKDDFSCTCLTIAFASSTRS